MDSRPFSVSYNMSEVPFSRASGRIVQDAKYHITRLKAEHFKLSNEIINLRNATEQLKKININAEDTRRIAEESAREISNKQEQFLVLNTALDVQVNKLSVKELEQQTEEMRLQNKNLLSELETSFSEKLRKEKMLQDLRTELNEQEELTKSEIESLSEEDRIEYDRCHEVNKKLKAMGKELTKKLELAKSKVINYEERLAGSSENKQTKYELIRKLNEASAKYKKIKEEMEHVLTPEQERHKLLKQVKEDKAQIELLDKYIATAEENLERREEDLSVVNVEMSDVWQERLKKYSELFKKEKSMEEEIQKYQEEYALQKTKIEELRVIISEGLIHISNNIAGESVQESLGGDTPHNEQDSSVQNIKSKGPKTVAELTIDYNKLKATIKNLNAKQIWYQEELIRAKEERRRLLLEMEKFKNVDEDLKELNEKKRELTEKQSSQTSVLESTKSAVAEATRRNTDLQGQVSSNTMYAEQLKLEESYENLLQVNKEYAERKAELIEMCSNSELINTLNTLTDALNRDIKQKLQKNVSDLK